MANELRVTVGVPAYNESASIGALLSRLDEDPIVSEVIVVDDCSTDGTPDVVRRFSSKVRLVRNSRRSGQTAGWQTILRESRNEIVVFTDADSMPEAGAICELGREIERGFDVVGGLARPLGRVWPPARFTAGVYATLASLGWRDRQLIGRLFAVRKSWLTQTDLPSTVIANDLWLSAHAHNCGARFSYCARAVTRYLAPSNVRDFKSQRVRADAGYRQLSEWGMLRHGASSFPVRTILGALAIGVRRDPMGAAAWLGLQLLIRISPWPKVERPKGGLWEAQRSTKVADGA